MQILTVFMGTVLNTFCALFQMVLEVSALLRVTAFYDEEEKMILDEMLNKVTR
jgi:hypothetical protein